MLCLDRHRVEPFDEEDLHRAKAVAFSAAAAIRKAQLLEKVRRYAALMERVVKVDEAVFAGAAPGASRASSSTARCASAPTPAASSCSRARRGRVGGGSEAPPPRTAPDPARSRAARRGASAR